MKPKGNCGIHPPSCSRYVEASDSSWYISSSYLQPWYGEAIAQCLVSEYLLKYFPYEDFVIYEIGAGNGTLASNILDFLSSHYPEVYDRTRYTIIEISGNLVQKQKQKLRRKHPSVKVVHKSIFHWDIQEPAPCFFLAMEVVVSSLRSGIYDFLVVYCAL